MSYNQTRQPLCISLRPMNVMDRLAGVHALHIGKFRSTSSTLAHALMVVIGSRFIDETLRKIYNIQGKAWPFVDTENAWSTAEQDSENSTLRTES